MTDKRRTHLSFGEILVIALIAVGGAFALHTRRQPAFLTSDPDSAALAGREIETPVWDRDSLYRDLYGSLSAGEREVSFPYDCSDELFDVFRQVLADHPELFWLSGSGSLLKKTSGLSVTVDFRPEILIGGEEIETRSAELEARAEEILSRCSEGETLWDRLLLLHNILVDETDYDSEAAERLGGDEQTDDVLNQSTSAYGCLVNRRAVCSGYAAAFQLLSERLGAECRRVQGTELKGGAPHEWNVVRPEGFSGDWYQTDITWDDPLFSGEPLEGYRSYDYFCVTTEEILRTHIIDDPDAVPLCTADAYNYYVKLGCVLDSYDFDAVSTVVAGQIDNDCIYLKFPDEAAGEEAVDRLLKGQEIFDIPAVRNLDVKTARGTSSDTGTVCVWLVR